MLPMHWIFCGLMLNNVPAVLGNEGLPMTFGEKINADDIYQGKQDVTDILKIHFDYAIEIYHQLQGKESVDSQAVADVEEELKALDQAVKNILNEFDDEVNLENIKTNAVTPLTNFIDCFVQNSQKFIQAQNICLDINPLFPKLISYFQTDIRKDYAYLMESTFFTIPCFKNIIDLHLNLIEEFALIFPITQGLINQSDNQYDIESIVQNIISSTVQTINDMKIVRNDGYFTSTNFERFYYGQERDADLMFQKLMTSYADEKDPNNGRPYAYSISLGFPLTFSYQSGKQMKEDVNFVRFEGGFCIRDSGPSTPNCKKFVELNTPKEWNEIINSMKKYFPNEGPELIDNIGHNFAYHGCKNGTSFVLRDAPSDVLYINGVAYPECSNSNGSMKYDYYNILTTVDSEDDMEHCLEIIYF